VKHVSACLIFVSENVEIRRFSGTRDCFGCGAASSWISPRAASPLVL